MWSDYLHVQFDPAHLLAELGFTLIFDLVAAVFIGVVWRRIAPSLFGDTYRLFHVAYDMDHDIKHDPDRHEKAQFVSPWRVRFDPGANYVDIDVDPDYSPVPAPGDWDGHDKDECLLCMSDEKFRAALDTHRVLLDQAGKVDG